MRNMSVSSRSATSRGNLKDLPPLPRDLDKELFDGVFLEPRLEERNIDFKMPPSFAYSSTMSHVLLAACQPGQKAREGVFEGSQRGRFTYHLLHRLRGTPLSITYAALMDAVSKQLVISTEKSSTDADDTDVQRPHCEGKYKWRILFSTEEERPSESFALAYEPTQLVQTGAQNREALYVAVGTMRGACMDTTFVYRYPKHTEETASLGEVLLAPTKVEAKRSQVKVIEGDPGPVSKEGLGHVKTPMASVKTWGFQTMKIWCAEGVKLASPRDATAAAFGVGTDSDADISIYRTETGSDVLEKHDPLAKHFTSSWPKVSFPDPITNNAVALEAIAKFNFHLYRFNPFSAVRQELQFDVQLHPLQLRENGGLHMIHDRIPGSNDLLSSALLHKFHSDRPSTYAICDDGVKEATVTDTIPYYGVTVVNQSKFDLFVYVFYFSASDFSIAVSILLDSSASV